MDIEEGIPPPALAQKKEKEEKGDTDDEEASGPDPAEVKKRFSALKRQFNKSEKASAKSRTSKAALKEQEKLGEIFQFLKLSPLSSKLGPCTGSFRDNKRSRKILVHRLCQKRQNASQGVYSGVCRK